MSSNLGPRIARLERATVGRAQLRGFIGPNCPGRISPPEDWTIIGPLNNGLYCFRTEAIYDGWCQKNGLDPDQGILLRIVYGGVVTNET